MTTSLKDGNAVHSRGTEVAPPNREVDGLQHISYTPILLLPISESVMGWDIKW